MDMHSSKIEATTRKITFQPWNFALIETSEMSGDLPLNYHGTPACDTQRINHQRKTARVRRFYEKPCLQVSNNHQKVRCCIFQSCCTSSVTWNHLLDSQQPKETFCLHKMDVTNFCLLLLLLLLRTTWNVVDVCRFDSFMLCALRKNWRWQNWSWHIPCHHSVDMTVVINCDAINNETKLSMDQCRFQQMFWLRNSFDWRQNTHLHLILCALFPKMCPFVLKKGSTAWTFIHA